MDRREIARQNKARKYWKVKAYGEQNYRDNEAFDYKLFDTIIHPSILRLH
jgi:hypothetical protein